MRIPRIAVVAFVALALVGCTPDDPTPAPTDTVEPTQSVTPQPEETTTPPVDPVGLSDTDRQNLHDSIESGNTAALEQYLTTPVNFIIAASECCEPLTPLEAISGLDYISAAVGPWSEPSASVLAQYRAGYYVDYFSEGAYVIQSSHADPYVVSFQVTGQKVSGIFVGGGASLLYP